MDPQTGVCLSVRTLAVCCSVRRSVFVGAQFSGRAQVNKVPNQLFIISDVIFEPPH